MVEQEAVNFEVRGSSPLGGAKHLTLDFYYSDLDIRTFGILQM